MMIPEQLENFLYLPAPNKKLNELIDDICQGISVICTLPEQINPVAFYSVIDKKCRKNGLSCEILDDDCDMLPENYIAQGYGIRISPGEQFSVEKFFDDDSIADVLIIKLSELSSIMVQQWVRFLKKWSGYARTYQARTKKFPKVLILITNQTELARKVKEDVYLKSYYFWGWFSTLELLLVAKSIVVEQGLTFEEGLWVESVIVELAGTDPELFYWLFVHDRFTDTNTPEGMIQQSCELLIEFCKEKGWTKESISTLFDTGWNNWCKYNAFAKKRPLTPPQELDDLWHAGMADWNDGDGVFIHSAVLALMGDTATLEHRIWRGQIRVLFPVLDRIRKEICKYLNWSYKQKWVTFCETHKDPYNPYDVTYQNGITVTEYNVITDFFRLNESNSQVLRGLWVNIDKLRQARNKLAHSEFLCWVEFSRLIKAVKIMEDWLMEINGRKTALPPARYRGAVSGAE